MACTRRARSPRSRISSVLGCLVPLLLLAVAAAPAAAAVPTPASHFGFEPGADGRLASWSALVAYYEKVAAASDRVEVRDLGPTTLGNRFVLVTVSSPANLARAARLREINHALADPGDAPLPAGRVDELAREGVATVAVSLGLHATEVAAAQMGPRLVYRLATANDEDTLRVLDNVVLLLFPSFNPDGLEMVAAWNDETRGTRLQGAPYPDLYHHYAGHDNNRDGYFFNLAESRMFSDVLYHEWYPQAYLDVHQMGPYGPRLYIPPYLDPIHPNVDPMVWWEHLFVGGSMAVALERAGVTGVESGAPYTGWWMGSFHMITNYHNIAGMLTESASCRLASPMLVHRQQLDGADRGLPFYGPQRFFAHPWEGGWWRLADLVHQQEVSTFALLDNAARYRGMWLRDMALKAGRNIERGRTEAPAAYVVPASQHDPLTTLDLLRRLMRAGVHVDRVTRDLVVDGRAVAAGDYAIPLAQPLRAYVKSLLERISYPDNAWTRDQQGAPLRPYDLAASTLAEHMGVEVVPVASLPADALSPLEAPPEPQGRVVAPAAGEAAGWLVSHEVNAAFRATNRVLAAGGRVRWLEKPLRAAGREWGPGTLWLPAAEKGEGTTAEAAAALARETGVTLVGLEAPPRGAALALRPLRCGLYHRGRGGNADEGWTRYLFDTWGFPYERLDADAVRSGGLVERFDVIVLPDDTPERLLGPTEKGRGGETAAAADEEYPEELLPEKDRRGLGEPGVEALRAFVRAGGTLVTLDTASRLVIDRFGVPVKDAVAGLSRAAFTCPGSTVWLDLDTSHPLAYGMPRRALAVNWESPAFELTGTSFADRIDVVASYPREDILRSGWLVGGERLAGKAALLSVGYGKGRLVMIGFRPQLRAQTAGTFKVFFNALYLAGARPVTLP